MRCAAPTGRHIGGASFIEGVLSRLRLGHQLTTAITQGLAVDTVHPVVFKKNRPRSAAVADGSLHSGRRESRSRHLVNNELGNGNDRVLEVQRTRDGFYRAGHSEDRRPDRIVQDSIDAGVTSVDSVQDVEAPHGKGGLPNIECQLSRRPCNDASGPVRAAGRPREEVRCIVVCFDDRWRGCTHDRQQFRMTLMVGSVDQAGHVRQGDSPRIRKVCSTRELWRLFGETASALTLVFLL